MVNEHIAESHEEAAMDRVGFGFWVYLMTDLLMFAVLFAVFAVLRDATHGGPSGQELFKLPFVLTETLILLTSSFTAGIGMLAAHRGIKSQVLTWFGLTSVLVWPSWGWNCMSLLNLSTKAIPGRAMLRFPRSLRLLVPTDCTLLRDCCGWVLP